MSQHATPSIHTVEGVASDLHVEVHATQNPRGLPPVLLIHGFSSSIDLNWARTGWIRELGRSGRTTIAVDLPGHGSSPAPDDMDSYSPSKLRADLLQIITEVGVVPLREDLADSGVDVLGYSLGARIGWELAATQPELIRRAVLGGAGHNDPLALFDVSAAQQYLADGTPIADESTAALLKMAQLVPSNNIFAFLTLIGAAKMEPFDPRDAIPRQPVLLATGSEDPRAQALPYLAELIAGVHGHVEQILLAGRTHTDAITSREFKNAAVEFLNRDA